MIRIRINLSIDLDVFMAVDMYNFYEAISNYKGYATSPNDKSSPIIALKS